MLQLSNGMEMTLAREKNDAACRRIQTQKMTDRIPCLSSGPKVHAPARYDEDAQNFYK
jgi:hypothetical protein